MNLYYEKIFMLFIILLCAYSFAHAHGGRTDSCGGHNDHKRGGYHVHNYEKYNSCYPPAESSPKSKESDPSNDKKNEKKEYSILKDDIKKLDNKIGERGTEVGRQVIGILLGNSFTS